MGVVTPRGEVLRTPRVSGSRSIVSGRIQMPIHDWKQVDPNLFHDFHQTWTISIRNALNAGLLPKGYSALAEQHAPTLVPDVLAVQSQKAEDRGEEPVGGGVITALLPK